MALRGRAAGQAGSVRTALRSGGQRAHGVRIPAVCLGSCLCIQPDSAHPAPAPRLPARPASAPRLPCCPAPLAPRPHSAAMPLLCPALRAFTFVYSHLSIIRLHVYMYTCTCVYVCVSKNTFVYARHRARVVPAVGADAPTAVRYYSGFFVALPARNALMLCVLHPPKGYCFPCVSLCVSLAVLVASVTACAHPARSTVRTAPPAPTGEPRHHPRRARSRLHSP